MSCMRCDSSAMRHWRSASLSWCFRIAALISPRIMPKCLQRKVDVLGQAADPCPAPAGGRRRASFCPSHHLAYGTKLAGAAAKACRGLTGLNVSHAPALQRLADRLEELLAVLLDQRLEERHAEHLAFAFVDARGQELVDVVAEQVALAGRTGRRASS